MTPSDLRIKIERIVTEEVAPMLQLSQGSIEILNIEDGVVQVRLNGACGSCPSSIQATIMGIEQELCKRLPEVAYLEAVP